MLNQIHSWHTRLLSFGGRIQLIQSALFGIQAYWSTIFILPKKIIKDIESATKNFLWSGSDISKSAPKVSWAALCCLKEEGGLGLKSVLQWNRTAILKQLWALCMKADVLRIKWIHTNFIKDQSLWHMKTPIDSSWTVRKMFKLRDIVRSYIKSVIGNGKNL
ncbi:hypothetical protein CsSME_00042533 [Camellia sinensis var. sinensis]